MEIFFEFRLPSEPTTVSGSGIIDHIAVSKIAGGAFQEMLENPEVLKLY